MTGRLLGCVLLTTWGVLSCSRPLDTRTLVPVAAPQPDQTPQTLNQAEQVREAGREDIYETALVQLSRSDDAAARWRALAEMGLFLLSHERTDEAIIALQAAADQSPDLRPFLLLELAGAHQKRGDLVSAAQLVESIAREFPASTAATQARLRLPAIYAAAGDRERSAAAAAQLIGIRVDELTERDFAAAAEGLERAGWVDLSASLRMRMLSEFPQGRFTEQTYGRLTALGDPSPLSSLGFDETVTLADRLARVNRYPEALDLLQRAQTRFPDRATAPQLRFTRMRSLFNSRQYDEVIRIKKFARGEPFFLASELLRARAYWRNDQHRQFLDRIQRILKDRRPSAERTEAKLILSKYYTVDERDYAKAARLLEQAIAEVGTGEHGEHLWNLGWIYTLAGHDDKALATFDRYLQAYPDADYTTNVLFWSGKIHERRGDLASRDSAFQRLIATFPYAYYSYRARQILGLPLTAPTSVESSFAFPAMADGSDPRLALVRELHTLGLTEYAAAEMRRIAGDTPSDPVLAYRLAELYVDAGEPLKAIILLQRNFRNIIRHGAMNVPARFWEILYPRLYWNEITAAAERSLLDPYLISSIIRQESGFEPTVVSSAGAVGLMQIMPDEASAIAARAGVGIAAGRDQLFEPGLNVILGAIEFVQKLDAMNGNQVLAIASYNAGEEAVGRWIASTPAEDVDAFIDSIPFSETKLYVKNVLRNNHEYRRIYFNG